IERVLDPRLSLGNAPARATCVLDDDQLRRTSRAADGLQQRTFVESFAAQRNEQCRTGVWVRAQPLHHPVRVGVGIAAREADQIYAPLAERVDNLARHMMRAFDQVGDDDVVADALAPIAAQVTSQAHSASFTNWCPCSSV